MILRDCLLHVGETLKLCDKRSDCGRIQRKIQEGGEPTVGGLARGIKGSRKRRELEQGGGEFLGRNASGEGYHWIANAVRGRT